MLQSNGVYGSPIFLAFALINGGSVMPRLEHSNRIFKIQAPLWYQANLERNFTYASTNNYLCSNQYSLNNNILYSVLETPKSSGNQSSRNCSDDDTSTAFTYTGRSGISAGISGTYDMLWNVSFDWSLPCNLPKSLDQECERTWLTSEEHVHVHLYPIVSSRTMVVRERIYHMDRSVKIYSPYLSSGK